MTSKNDNPRLVSAEDIEGLSQRRLADYKHKYGLREARRSSAPA